MKKLARIEVRMEALVEKNIIVINPFLTKQIKKYYIFDLETGKKRYVPNNDVVNQTIMLDQKDTRLEIPISKESKEIKKYKQVILSLDPRNKYKSIDIKVYDSSFVEGLNMVSKEDVNWSSIETKKRH